MIPKRLSKLASLLVSDSNDSQEAIDELVRQIAASKSGAGLVELCQIEAVEAIFYGEADATEAIGEALVRQLVDQASDENVLGFIHASLGLPLEKAVLPLPAPTKPKLLRGLDRGIEIVRALVDGESPLAGALLLLARLPSADGGDAMRLSKHLRAKETAGTAGFSIALLASRCELGSQHVAVKAARVAMMKLIEKLPAKPTPKTALPVAFAASALLLLGASNEVGGVRGAKGKPRPLDAGLSSAAALALAVSAPVPASFGWALSVCKRTSVDLLVAVIRLVGSLPGALDLKPIVEAIARAPVTRADGCELLARLLISVGFPDGLPSGPGLRLDKLSPVERRVLESLAASRFERADLAMRSLGFWSHEALVEFLAERGPRFRTVELTGATSGRAPAVWAWRAAVLGVLSTKEAFDALVRSDEVALTSELLLSRKERPITESLLMTAETAERDQSLALELIGWHEQHDADWLSRLAAARTGPYEAAFVALGILRAAEQGRVTIGPEDEWVITDAFLSAKVLEPTRSLVARLPMGERLLAKAGGIFRRAATT